MNNISTHISTTYKVMFDTSYELGNFEKVTCASLNDALKVARLAITAGAYYATVTTETETVVRAGFKTTRRSTTIDITFHPDEPLCFSHKYMYYGNGVGLAWFRKYRGSYKGEYC